MLSPTLGTANNYVVSSSKIQSYHFYLTFVPIERPDPNTFGPGRSGAPRGFNATPLFTII